MKRFVTSSLILLLALCWAVAWTPAPAGAAPGSGASTDQEEVWVQQNSPTTADLSAVTAPNSETACAVGKDGNVVFTRNAGDNWTMQKRLFRANLHDVCSTDSDHFWYVGDGGSIGRTTNGGASWKLGWCNMSNPLTGISMVTNNVGWACGFHTFFNWHSSMWHTSSGIRFTDQDWWKRRNVYSVSAWDRLHAVAVGSNANGSRQLCFRTTNGLRWTRIEVSTEMLLSVCVVPGTSKAFAVGNRGRAYVCDNYGGKMSDWRRLYTRVAADLWDVEVVDANTLWAVGEGGTIIKSTDGGANWTRQESPTRADLRGVVSVDKHHAWAVGQNGTILYAMPQPRITGCQPGEVPQGYEGLINVNGSNTNFKSGASKAVFTPGSGISVVSTSAATETDANVYIKVDDNAPAGARDVNVVTGKETPTALADGLIIRKKPPRPPHVDSISPSKGPVGTYVTLRGDNFGSVRGASNVYFHPWASATDYTYWDDDTITCRVPSYAESGGVRVQTKAGSSNKVFFEVTEPQVPQIIDTEPNWIRQGDPATPIRIEGKYTHFADPVSQAVFEPGNGITVTGVQVVDSNTAVATIVVDINAPTGPRDVNVVTGSEKPKPMAGGLTVQPHSSNPPVLNSVSPAAGAVGDEVTLDGEKFGSDRGGSYVSFGGARATGYPAWGDTRIKCLVPADAKTGMVTVTTPEGTSGGELFTVGIPFVKDCEPKEAVQGHQIEVDILGKYTHFANGVSRATFSGKGISVPATAVSDATHATAQIQVKGDAPPGYSDVNMETGAETPQALKNAFLVYAAPPGPPNLHDVSPATGRVGTTVVLSGVNFGQARGSSTVTFNGKPAGHYISWDDDRIVCKVPFGASTGFVDVVTPWGTSYGLYFEVKDFEFYFAEGSARDNFDTYYAISNPGEQEAPVKVTCMLEDGKTKQQQLTVPAHSRKTVAARSVLGSGSGRAEDFSAKVECLNDQIIIAERPMYFNYKGKWSDGHDAFGLLDPERELLFSEGSCRPGFEPYLTFLNPGAVKAEVTITYMLGNTKTKTQDVSVPAQSRLTVPVLDTLGSADDPAHDFSVKVECTNGQEVVAERPMYFDYHNKWNGGHDAMGQLTPTTQAYFAEGASRPDFEPFVCVQNPGLAQAQVRITFFNSVGDEIERVARVAPKSRFTMNVADVLGLLYDAAADFSVKVVSLDGQEIVVERPMYFNYDCEWNGGHDVAGASAPASMFLFSEGTCRLNFKPYFTIMNPELAHADVRITYMLGNGTTKEQAVLVPASSRATVSVSDFLGSADDAAHDFSARVACVNNQDIVVERPMYFNYNCVWNGGSDVLGFHAD